MSRLNSDNSVGHTCLSKLIAIIRTVRPINCVMIGFAVTIGEFIALRRLPLLQEALLGSLTASLLMAGTMALNDYYDLEIDRVNRPEKPLPSGTLATFQVISLGAIACATGLVTAAMLNWASLTIAAFALSLMLYYNTLGKRTGFLGNILVSVCIGLPFIFGGATVGRITPALVFFSLIAFTANLGREVTKGIIDVEGDRSGMIRTVAVAHGPRKASRLSVALYMIAVCLSFAPSLLGLVGLGYIPLVLLSDTGFVMSSITLVRSFDRENAKRTKNRVMIWMFLGLLAFIAGSI